MAKEEKGYWFSTEKGTHIHAEEGESKESAMKKRFSNFGKEKEYKESFDEINSKRMGTNQDWKKSLNIPKGHKPTKKELDKEVTDMFKSREEGEKFINETKWESEKDKQNAIDRLNRAFPKKPQQFKLDRKKYPDVETTPYGFIYNVNGTSIEDIAEHMKRSGMGYDPNKKYGFSVAKDGEEYIYETFEDAYNSVKGKKEKSISYDEFFESPSNKQIVDDYVEDYIFRARRNNEQDNVSVDKVLEEFKKDWVGFYSKENEPLIKQRIKEKLGE